VLPLENAYAAHFVVCGLQACEQHQAEPRSVSAFNFNARALVTTRSIRLAAHVQQLSKKALQF
jgi:hypothetical protein